MDNQRNEVTLATELLHELKATSKIWFIAFCIMVVLEFATIVGFMWYISLPVDELTIENDDGNANYIGNDLNGDLNNGENSEKAESSETAQTETLNDGN